jgi:hypothetical protein
MLALFLGIFMSFYITRRNYSLEPFSCTSSFEDFFARFAAVAPHPLMRRVSQFFHDQQQTLHSIRLTPKLYTIAELNTLYPGLDFQAKAKQKRSLNIKDVLNNIHTLHLKEEDVSCILHLSELLKRKEEVADHLEKTPQRFTVKKMEPSATEQADDEGVDSTAQRVYSFSLFKNDIVIHLKKKRLHQDCTLGEGHNVKAHRAIHLSDQGISLVAELTTHDPFSRTKHSTKPHSLPSIKNFLTSPLMPPTLYARYEKPEAPKGSALKSCKLLPLYQIDCYNLLHYHTNIQPFLPLEVQWKLFAFLVKSLKIIHERGLVYRDLKLENVLVSFSTQEEQAIDFTRVNFALCDFDLVTPEETITNHRDWQGSIEYWPESIQKRKFVELQHRPSEMYALGLLLEEIFQNAAYSSQKEETFIDTLFTHMTQVSPKDRPDITVVATTIEEFLQTAHPDYTWIQEFFSHAPPVQA